MSSAAARPLALLAGVGAAAAALAYLRRRLRPKLVLHYHPISQPARAAWALARALDPHGERVELKGVALEQGEHKSGAFLALNPLGQVPALSDDTGWSVGESHAILRYLAAELPGGESFYPRRRPKARARCDEYLAWHHSNTRKGVPFFFHKHACRAFGMEPDRARQAAGREAYEAAAVKMNSHFLAQAAAEGPFMGGGAPSLADLAAYAELGPLQWDDELGPFLFNLERVGAWLRAMRAQRWHAEVMAPTRGLMRVRRSE